MVWTYYGFIFLYEYFLFSIVKKAVVVIHID